MISVQEARCQFNIHCQTRGLWSRHLHDASTWNRVVMSHICLSPMTDEAISGGAMSNLASYYVIRDLNEEWKW
jgi:hypothetical protein